MRKLLVALSFAVLLAGCQARFGDDDIEKLKGEITKQAESKGLKIQSIDINKDSDVKLTGEAKLTDPKVPGEVFTWHCNAEMGEDATYSWSCKPNEIDMLKDKIRETITAQKLGVDAIVLDRHSNGDYDGYVRVSNPADPTDTARWNCHAALKPGTSGNTAKFSWNCKP